MRKLCISTMVAMAIYIAAPPLAFAIEAYECLVPILGVTMEKKPTGTVTYLIVSFNERKDTGGLMVHFRESPGKFSRMAQTAVEQAIYRTAHSLGISTDSWTITLTVPYPNVTIYGESLSAMIGLTVAAISQGMFVAPDRVMTGTITPDGHIGAVGAVPLKIAAAKEARFYRVIVPADKKDSWDGDYTTPFLMQITPVDSVREAYAALTEIMPERRR